MGQTGSSDSSAAISFVDDDCVVLVEEAIRLTFRQHDPVGHQSDQSQRPGCVGEADAVPHFAAGLTLQFFRESRRNGSGRDAPGLRVSDHTADPSPHPEQYLRQLRRFPGSRLAADDDNLAAFNADFRSPN